MMATSLRLWCQATRKLRLSPKAKHLTSIFKRSILSAAYSCNEVWKAHLQDPSLEQVSLSEFAIQIREQLEKTGHVSAIDMNVLVHQFHKLDDNEEEAEFMEDVLAKFNRCKECLPRSDSMAHAIVRGYVESGLSSRLLPLLSQRLTYGIFPNAYTLNYLMDRFIKNDDFAKAAHVAYCSMIQEEFESPVNALLALYACSKHLVTCNVEDLAPPPKEESDGEEDWIKVKYIPFPFYDDHFDIKDERFLLGKTLLELGKLKSLDLSEDLRSSLRVTGLGLYHKFSQGLNYLQKIAESSSATVSEEALRYFSESLEKVEARDANEEEVEIELRTIDDVIHRLLPTVEEKEEYLSSLAKVKETLLSAGKIDSEFSLEKSVEEYVKANIEHHQPQEIQNQVGAFKLWSEERQQELARQVEEFRRSQRLEEMKRQIKELQEQEEILSYFDSEENVRLSFLDEDRAKDKNLTISK